MNYLKCSECGKVAPLHLQSDDWKEKYNKLIQLEIDLGLGEILLKVGKISCGAGFELLARRIGRVGVAREG